MRSFVSFIISLIALCACSSNEQGRTYSIVVDPDAGEKVEYAVGKLEKTLADRGITTERATNLENASGDRIIVAGLASGPGSAAALVRQENRQVPATAEALAVWKTKYDGKPVLALAGHDDQGVMYAVLDAAVRMGWSGDPLENVNEITEQPELATRAISTYTMNRTVWETKFYDDRYWEKYFDLLSLNRFNSFVIIFGYENGGFLAPPYPYFFDVAGFPGVKMTGLAKEDQQRNLARLNKLIDMAHKRGIRLSVAVWDHIYRGGVQAGGLVGLDEFRPELAVGVTGDNLIAYTKAALSELVKQVPKLDGIEFRMHGESGLRRGEQEAFWADVFKSVKAVAPEMNFVLRAKDMPESVIRAAIDEGINFRIETKYWMEQMGMPWHSTRINAKNQQDRRQSYADMLRYPQEYKMYWRLWSGGTTRILLWGNPDYARRFTQSAKLYAGDTYEVNEPLATKMEAMPHDAPSFDLLNPAYQYYEYEFERYWHFFQVFGRMGYNSHQPSDIWDREFESRFGKKAGPVVEQALEEASWILPRIVASIAPYGVFPTTRGWVEKQALGTLAEYAAGEGSDLEQFAGFDEEAHLMIEGGETAKIRPSMTSVWFKDASDRLNEQIRQAEKAMGKEENKEFYSTITDLKILSNLALYHSRRVPAAVNYCIFLRTNDVAALDRAIEHEKNAIEAWKQIIAAAGDVYAPDLMLGIRSAYFDGLTHHLSGHWKDELGYLEEDLTALEQQRRDFTPESTPLNAPEYRVAQRSDNAGLFQVALGETDSAPIGKPLTVQVKVTGKNGIKWVRLRYRAVNQRLNYSTLEMTPSNERNTYQAVIPATEINPQFDLMYFVEVMDNAGNGKIYPDLYKETPYVIVKLDKP